MVTFDDSESEEANSDGEVVEGLMAIVKNKEAESKYATNSEPASEEDLNSDDENEVFASFSTSELKVVKLEEVVACDASDSKNESKYEKSFQRFLAKSVDRSLMASMIYGVSRNGMYGIGYSRPSRNEPPMPKAKSLYEHFVPSGTILPEPLPIKVANPLLKKGTFSRTKYHAQGCQNV